MSFANFTEQANTQVGETQDADTAVARPVRVVSERSTCRTRGTNPQAALDWLRKVHGPEGVEDVLSALDRRDCALIREGRIAAHDWVPFLVHARLLQTIDAVHGTGDLALLRTVGRYMGARDFPMVVRPLLRMVGPMFFLDRTMSMWRLYHSSGRWTITRGSREAIAVLSDHPEHHQAFCATFIGWIEGAISLTGARDVQMREMRCAARGASECSFVISWIA